MQMPAAADGSPNGEAVQSEKRTPSSSNRLLEEVVVTATKREENIQNVPIAITAFTADKLDAVGVQSPHDLPRITPGLTFTSSASYNIVYLRGVGSDAFLPAADQDVPTYLDGVALVQGEGSQDTLGRVERVEVLKGPQGTLFGRNSTGGAISIVTPDPKPEFLGDINVDVGNFGTRNVLAFVNVPIGENLAATISAFDYTHDPYQKNDAGPTLATYSRGGRGKIVWHATNDLSFNLAGLYGETSGNTGMAKENTRVSLYWRPLVPQDPSADYHYSENITSGIAQYNYLYYGGFDWKLPWVEIKGIGSDQKVYADYANYDYDGSTSPLVSFRPVDEFNQQQTGEVQFLSTPDTPFARYLTFVGGLYYLQGKGGFPTLDLNVAAQIPALVAIPGVSNFLGSLNGVLANLGLALPVNQAITAVSGGILTTKSESAYFQGTLHLQELLSLSKELNAVAGLRVDRETRGLQDNRLGVINPLTLKEITALRFHVPDVSQVQLPYKLGLQWFPVDDTQLYAGFARGFTAPTYNTVNFFSAPDQLRAQRTDSYEIGLKTQPFDYNLTFNAAAFYISQTDLLTGYASITSGGVVRFDNVPKARNYGLEFDASWQPMPDLDPGLVLLGSFAYLNAKYVNYPNARGYDVTTGLSYGKGAFLPARDVSGNDVVRTPRISYNIGINQSIPFDEDNTLELAVESSYSAKFYFDPANTPEFANPSYRLVDARIAYFYRPAGIEITAYGKNLTQAKYYKALFLLDPGRNVELNDPRTFGLRFKYSF